MPKDSARTRPYDAARYLQSEAQMAAYLEAALESGDTKLITLALGNIARAKVMTEVAGMVEEGVPDLATFLKVVRALGLSLHAAPAHV